MVDLKSDIYGEEIFRIPVGQGMYTSELASNIPDGFAQKAFNVVATGDSLENRVGLRPSSVAWHQNNNTLISGDAFRIQELDRRGDLPAMGWISYDVSFNYSLNFIRAAGGVAGGDGFMQVAMPIGAGGMCNYNGVHYFSTFDAAKMYKITGFNWVADSITYSSIPSAAGIGSPRLDSIFTFKDRLWGIYNNLLYFTETATVGGLPETWAATNYVIFAGPRGYSRIMCVVPLRNKLIVFTETGAFTLLVEGEPDSWILRILDVKSSSTYPQCAFESKGIVYFVNTEGVWATDGNSVAKLSGTIEDQFFLSQGSRLHSIASYEDGMIVSVTRLTSTAHADSVNSKIFYSKLDPVGWTEWNIDSGDGTANAFGANRLVQVLTVSPKVVTFLNVDPVSFALVGVTDSIEGVPQSVRYQLIIFDGGQDLLRPPASPGEVITVPVSCVVKTKYIDAGNAYRNKQNKHGYVEMYTSDTMHNFTTSWDIDATTSVGTVVRETPTQDFTVGQTSNLLRIPSDFPFRRCALTLKTSLQSNTSQIKIKDLAIVINTDRDVQERVQ